MEQVRRVVVHDRNPVFDPVVLARRPSRAVLLLAALALLIQIVALGEVLAGEGMRVGPFEHVSFAVVALLWLVVGILIFLQRQGSHAGSAFLLSSAVGSIFLALGTLYQVNLLNAMIYAAGLLLFPPLVYAFARWADDTRGRGRWEALLYLPALLLIWPSATGLAHRYTSLAWRLALIVVTLYLVGAIVQAWLDLRQAKTPEGAAQARALLVGLTAGTGPGILTFIIPLVLTGSLTVATGWLPPLILLFLLAMSYAVLLYEFSEADLIVRRGVVYGIITLLIVLAYGALGVVLVASRASVTSPGGGLSFVAVTILVGAAFGPLHYAARRVVDWLLYGQPTERWTLLQALSARLATVMQPGELGEVLVREIDQALHLRGAFLLRREPGGEFAIYHPVGDARALPTMVPGDVIHQAVFDPLTTILLLHAKPLTPGRGETVPVQYEMLDALKVSLAIPLQRGTRASGSPGHETVLCLQPKLSHDTFDRDDLELLAPVIRQATTALDNALLFASLEEKIQELRGAYRRIAGEQEAERARLARELHDGTAQELASLITLSAVAERQLQGDPDAVRATLNRLRGQAEHAYQGVRLASHALRPSMLDDFGLAPTLTRYLGQFGEATGIAIVSRVDDVGELPDDVELALFRVAQECMENIRKHSGAQEAVLHLSRSDGHVSLSVRDTGRGLSVSTRRGMGLAGMRERIEAVGGSIFVEGGSGHGVSVEAIIPVGSNT